jgi:pyridoxal phosphate enzyme (YggS family)
MSVAANLARIRKHLGSSPVRLIAVTKTVGVDLVQEAFNCGITEFGENRVLDAIDKQTDMPPHVADKIRWHLIGHLQTNKVKRVIGKFVLIHSVDSLRLAEEISREAHKLASRQPILLQTKMVEDPNKSGFDPADLTAAMPQLMTLPGIDLQGLMTMAPLSQDRQIWRQSFSGLRQLRDDLQEQFGANLKELSMGMSQDWQEAVACGATMVRLGRAIFGEDAA